MDPDYTGEPRGKNDRHSCSFFEGPNAGKVQKSITKGCWKEQEDGSYDSVTDPEKTVVCEPTDPPADPDLLESGPRAPGGRAGPVGR